MKSERLFLCLFAVWLFVASGCSRDDVSSDVNLDLLQKLTDPEKINKFIVDCTQDVYLWEALTDWKKYNKYDVYRAYSGKKELHYELFDTLLYEGDQWSALTEDVDGLLSSLQGISTTYGYALIGGKFSNTDNYFAIILYTYPGAPAEKAGLKRGDIIVGINGGDITASNYADLYYSSSVSLDLGYVNMGGYISLKPGSIEMTAVKMYENPVNTVRIIEKKGHKIGYLCYTDYVDTSERELSGVFAGFKAEGVTDVVLDLRYNGGGHAVTAKFLSSILAPRAVVKNKEIYLTQKWNDLYDSYWQKDGRNNNEYFIDTLSVNMDLSRVYVLVTGNTASASEATIIGLKPYMDVVLVGEATHGKYYGGYVLAADDYYEGSSGYNREQYLNISNWGMYIMVYRYANKNNYPDFSGGLAPERSLAAQEDYFDLKPFGDETDPLLGKALENITGERYVASRASASLNLLPYMVFPVDMEYKSIVRKNLIHNAPLPHVFD
ncbi:MAG: PDZ domain-containing protein [Tannerella sp.]|jgi:C-terminal processing protease CtpA/Prc|nr:PDZ domain-containing protein [Tannerella sp.]